MTVYQYLCLFGVPTLLAGLWGYAIAKIRMFRNDVQALKAGTQAVLRNNLVEMYEKYYKDGEAPTYIKDNYENLYRQYHALGANGVMDSYYENFMSLPTKQN